VAGERLCVQTDTNHWLAESLKNQLLLRIQSMRVQEAYMVIIYLQHGDISIQQFNKTACSQQQFPII